jgi:chemotaxis protein CheC
LDRAAEVLAAMLDASVRISAPELRALRFAEVMAALGMEAKASVSAVEMGFSGEFQGLAQLIFLSEDAGRLADCVAAGLQLDAEEDLESARVGTLCEVGNIVINAILGTIANAVGVELSYAVPLFLRGEPEKILSAAAHGSDDIVILVRAHFQVACVEVEGDIAFFLSLASIKSLTLALERIPHA